jgi:hypothetical protein
MSTPNQAQVRARLRRAAAVDALHQLITEGRIATAQLQANEALQSKLITCGDYMQLVKLSEGR